MYNQQNDIPEFVTIFARNVVKIIQDFVQTEIHYNYNHDTDSLSFIFEPFYTIKFVYKISNITPTLIKTRTTVAMTAYTIVKKYKRHILGKFFKDAKNP